MDARFLYVIPNSKVSYRNFESEPISETYSQKYSDTIKYFLNMSVIDDEPYTLSMASDAFKLYADFMNTLEEAMREGNELENMRDWAGKKDTLARIAGLLHCATYPQPQDEHIQPDIIKNACAIMNCLIVHSRMPVIYWILSWREDEQPTCKQVDEVVDLFL